MEERNVIFEVTKVGLAVNSKWNVFVDNEAIGKIDFKQNLTKKLSKGRHTVQYKVGVQKTKVLDIVVADEDIIIECVWDGTVRNFHVVGGNDTNTTQATNVITENTQVQNSAVTEQPKLNTEANVNSTNNNQSESNSNIAKGIGALISIIITIVILGFSFGWWGSTSISDLNGTYKGALGESSEDYTITISNEKATLKEIVAGTVGTYTIKKGDYKNEFLFEDNGSVVFKVYYEKDTKEIKCFGAGKMSNKYFKGYK